VRYLEKTILSRNHGKPIDLTCFGLPFDREQTPCLSVEEHQAFFRVTRLSDAAPSNDAECRRNPSPRTAKIGKAPNH